MKIVLTDAKTVTNGDLDLSVFQQFGDVVCYDTTAYEEFMYKALERSLDTYVDMFYPKTDETKLLKIGQFAKAVGVPISTVRYWLRVGKLTPVAKSDGDFMLFSSEQVKEWKKK